MFGLLVSAVVGQPIHDVTSGMRCSNRRAVQCFARHYPQDYPEVESHILLHKVGLKETEIPVIMHPRMGGKSSIRLLRSMYYALKITLAVLIRCLQTAPCLGAGG